MIKVELLPDTVTIPEKISFVAKGCYQAEKPKIGELINIKNALFETGHHTTLQHNAFSFFIEGIAISDVTFGLHLASPFYNSSQRSGRFCGKMFDNPDFDFLSAYIRRYWPNIPEEQHKGIMDFVGSGIRMYRDNIAKATEVAKQFIKEERPFASEKYIEQNAPKFAQEQLRVFISTIFPTALTFTINLSALVAFYRVAWSPPLIDIITLMADILLQKYPELGYMFVRRDGNNPFSQLPRVEPLRWLDGILVKPKSHLDSVGNSSKFINPLPEDVHPLDLLHFDPIYMDNNVEEIKTKVEISIATMGQDQRHRTVERSKPNFTGNFYLPPIPKHLGLESEALGIMESWLSLWSNEIPQTLSTAIAPYGAMVGYRKSASYNDAIHETAKRLCWCAQEEIFHLNLSLRKQVVSQEGKDSPLLQIFSPHCVRTGKCGEGNRYCGRDIKNSSCFTERKI